ncbi:Peptidoglycan/LPS O-acetylase OafA/YrhL, contains acyltransferase and SGNH-hydrolase domains [Sphingobium faniae]|nr:Peptidoglycan/LPS O-acetylase OafA/YrhL, contains acyltransferase and SGNH-hydrolase domains [Sphingobium faniae]
MEQPRRSFSASLAAGRASPPYGASVPAAAYRADLDALRAIAVIGVLLFHVGFERAGGGFVGVDIFFVISGFLITQLMLRDLERGAFSLANFYHRRIKRIFPALILMLIVCTVVCTWLLLPDDLQRYGQSTAAAALFSSNIWFWLKTDYFDGPALFKPLLHTWSLAVEEQFYLFFPLFLRCIWPFGKAAMQIILATCVALSFAACLSIMRTDVSAAFYLTPFRAWELLLGSLLAAGAIPAITRPVLREIAAASGLALILFSILTYSELTTFPGVAALAPCLGTALVIHAGSSGECAINRAMAIRPLVAVGLISYSLYLWHWPIIVLARYLTIDELQWPSAGLLIALSFAAAWLSYYLVEQPFRTSRIKRPSVTIAACAIVTAGSAVAGVAIYAAHGWPGRFPADVSRLENYKNSENPNEDKCQRVKLQLARHSPCTIGDPAKASVFLWGDSHAGVLYSALAEIATDGPGTIYSATSRCPPLFQLGTDGVCVRGNARRLRYLRKHDEIGTVILAARWSLYLEGRAVDIGPDETNGNTPVLQRADGEQLERFSPAARAAFNRSLHQLVDALLASGKKIVLVYPVPELGYDVPSRAARMSARGENPAAFTIPASVYFRRQDHALAILDGLGHRPGLTRVYPEAILCPEGRCLSVLHGTPLYFDSHHLSKPGSRLLVPALRQAMAIGK